MTIHATWGDCKPPPTSNSVARARAHGPSVADDDEPARHRPGQLDQPATHHLQPSPCRTHANIVLGTAQPAPGSITSSAPRSTSRSTPTPSRRWRWSRCPCSPRRLRPACRPPPRRNLRRVRRPLRGVRRLRTNLQFVNVADRHGRSVVVGARSGEGESVTVANLRSPSASAGARVCLVDAACAARLVAEYRWARGTVGLTTILMAGSRSIALQPYERIRNLQVLGLGQIATHPLLQVEALVALLGERRSRFRHGAGAVPRCCPLRRPAIPVRVVPWTVCSRGRQQHRHRGARLEQLISMLNPVDAAFLGVRARPRERGVVRLPFTRTGPTRRTEIEADPAERRPRRRRRAGR